MYERSQLKNSLRIISHPMKDRHSVAVGVWAGVGGRYEENKIKGAAHFLEHIVFKGTKNYACEEIKQKIEGVGGALNAFTSEECTCYFAKVPTKHAEATFDILSDMILQPLIMKKDVDKERGVILEEIKMYNDLPQHLVGDFLDQLLWGSHPLGQNIAGTLDSVGQMSFEDLRRFHRYFYIPSNIVVSACGNLSHQKLLSLTQEKFGRLNIQGSISCVKASNEQSAPKLKFHKKPIEQMHLALGSLGFHREHPDRYALGILNIILGGNMSSRLFNEVREKRGLAYSISSGMKLFKDTGAFIVRGGVHNEKVVEAVDVILKELVKIAKSPVSSGELRRAKDYFIGQTLLSLEDTAEHMFWIGESIVATNRVETFKEAIRKVEKIGASDVKRVAGELFKASRMNLAVVGPLTERQESDLEKLF
ncbi:MAG: pitrilysin family protein [Candidatus Omnitrophota bacterium]